ncbi:SDR family NAD(P)-dependent oxidoreductase [Aliterella atlantica]|uniref:Short-chain dehydrogenase n=1 Tax=Aliterella atlantica CENA595 TaxID=1618023 RepID=A0A0D8ZUQ2_9CYAN|nr:SDR family oxidoreductase [Aliterella atlantica]KJH70971.1 short-chain dehydrogenase [Aliterella atlantica CENA595]
MSVAFSHSRYALITGASGGIGLEIAKLFARDRYNLVLVARSQQKLAQVAEELKQESGIAIKIIALDLALPTSPAEIFQAVQQEAIAIDTLVNNAGFATYGLFSETDVATELQMLQVNVVALTHLTKLFVPEMVKRKAGKVLNIASTAAFQPGPLMAVYYASKAYVLSFSEALANELQDFGITVTALCPGPTASGFQKRARMEKSKLVSNQKTMDAATVAQAGYRGLMQNQTVVVPGWKNQILAASVRFMPRNAVTNIVRNMQSQNHNS